MKSLGVCAIGLGAALSVSSIALEARAGSFDAEGRFRFDDRSIVRETFTDGRGQKAIKIVAGPDAIDGAGFGIVDATQEQFTLPLTFPKRDAVYRGRMWARKNRTIANVNVGYTDTGSPGFYARFFPTGLVTSDGWYELATAPFSVQGTRGTTGSVSIFGNGVDVDAFELVPEALDFAPLAACKPPVDAACRSNEQCIAGYCRDLDLVVPPLPPARDRADVVAYMQNRFRFFFGGRYTRAVRLPIALATLDRARGAASGWEFWNGVTTAIRQLHDWHTTMNGPPLPGGRGVLPVCFVEGDGDLSHGVAPKDAKYPDVLVSHAGSQKNSDLGPGDRLVAVNGVHPLVFAESLEAQDWNMWRADDPGTVAEPIERMSGLIRRFAEDFTVVRCKAGVCGAPETIKVASLPDGNVPSPYCDHRPGYHIAGPDPVSHNSYNGPFHGVLTDSQPNEDLYGMVWNDVYLDNSQNPYAESIDEFRKSAKGVVLDHRVGNGGTEPAAEYLTQLFRAPATLAAWGGFHLTTNLYDAPFTPTDGVALYQQFLGTEPYKVGSTSARTTNMPTALLLARDGSASDWFPLGMVGLNNVRVFGRPTAGAFSSYIEFDYYGQLAWRLASGDLLEPDGNTRIGRGVVPTEEIVPKQSDLVQGKDTAYLRALEWIRTCTGCK